MFLLFLQIYQTLDLQISVRLSPFCLFLQLKSDSIDNEIQGTSPAKVKEEGGSSQPDNPQGDDDNDETEWEDGSVPNPSLAMDYQENKINSVTIEFETPPDSAKRKPICRASAEEKVNTIKLYFRNLGRLDEKSSFQLDFCPKSAQ